MPVDYDKLLDELKDAIFGAVKDEANDFLDAHQDAKVFLADRAKRVAQLGVRYVKAADDAERAQVNTQLEVVQQSIRNELAGIAVSAEAQAKATFGKVVQTAIGVVVKALPTLAALV